MKMLALLFTCLLVVMTVSVAVSDVAVVDAARKPTKTPRPTKEPQPPPPTKEPTEVPPTATATAVPPTATMVSPTSTNTAVPSTPTSTPSPTATPTSTVFEGVPKCSKALHDKYVTTAPDGKSYPTWHPLLDQEDGHTCSHQHEHGSNPALLHPNWHPAFGYAAAHMGMNEPHAGFKVAVIPGPNDQPVGIMVHMGGGSLQRVCARFHSFETAWLANDGSLGAVITILGDFGRAENNDTQVKLTPPECPTQATTDGSTGVRQIPAITGTTIYEPWRVDLKKTVFGFTGDFTINSRSANTVCKTVPECPVGNPAVLNRTGTVRFVTGNKDVYGTKFRIDAANAKATGRFCTDPMGRMLVDCGQADAVAQYLAPGLAAGYPCGGHAGGGRGGTMLLCGDANTTIDINEKGGVPPGAPN